MTYQQILEGNKLIAEFMTQNSQMIVRESIIKKNRYHYSWDWLMPVVEKIESFWMSVQIFRNECYIQSTGTIDEKFPWLESYPNEGILFTDYNLEKIECVYNCIIEFINWYNQNVKK